MSSCVVWCCQATPMEWQILSIKYVIKLDVPQQIGTFCLLIVYFSINNHLVKIILIFMLQALMLSIGLGFWHFAKRVPVVRNDWIEYQSPNIMTIFAWKKFPWNVSYRKCDVVSSCEDRPCFWQRTLFELTSCLSECTLTQISIYTLWVWQGVTVTPLASRYMLLVISV